MQQQQPDAFVHLSLNCSSFWFVLIVIVNIFQYIVNTVNIYFWYVHIGSLLY